MDKERPIRDIIIDALDHRDEIGLKKYGVTLHDEECKPPTGCWHHEVYQELLDAIQYLAKAHLELQKAYKELSDRGDF